MPILLFVMTMLMIFAILAYGRLETFRNLSGLQGEFKHYIEKRERKYLNEQALHRYQGIVVKEVDQQRIQDDKSPASSTLSLYLFVKKQEALQKAAELAQFSLITKNLIQFLYQDKDFFKDAISKRQDVINELLLALPHVTENMKINEKKDLSNIKFNDPILDEFFYHILKGTPEVKYDSKTFKPIEGYPSLLNFITVKKKLNIRVYLASRELLMALFGDPLIVEEILKERKAIYKELNNNDSEQEKSTLVTNFRNAFIEKRLSGINDAMLNFDISKTDPSSYE